MKRREFIAGLAGATAWPIPARAQQPERVRRIGVLHGGGEKSEIEQARNSALLQQSVAPSVGVDVRPIAIQDAGELERDLAEFASIPNGGLIMTSTPLATIHRDLKRRKILVP